MTKVQGLCYIGQRQTETAKVNEDGWFARTIEWIAGTAGFLVSIALTIWLVLYILRFMFGVQY